MRAIAGASLRHGSVNDLRDRSARRCAQVITGEHSTGPRISAALSQIRRNCLIDGRYG